MVFCDIRTSNVTSTCVHCCHTLSLSFIEELEGEHNSPTLAAYIPNIYSCSRSATVTTDSFLGLSVNFLFSFCISFSNKITFKRTRSLSNAACFKHYNNVCACAVSALILLPVVNLSLEMYSAVV